MSSQICDTLQEMKTDTANANLVQETSTVNEKHTVKAVLLRTDGVAVEIVYDASPTKNTIKEILGVSPTIIGEWKKINVVLLRGKYTSLTAPLNTHELRFPFQGRKFYGDILLYRVNKEGILDNFTLSEYECFAAEKDIDDFERNAVVLSGDAKEKEEEEIKEMNKILSNVIAKQFEKRHGRKPSAWETRTFTQTVMQTISEIIGEDERLEEYLDESDEEEKRSAKKSPTGKKRKQITNQTPSKASTGLESEEEISEQLRSEIAEAIDIIREKGKQDAHYLADLVSETFYEINGREAELHDIADVFKRVKEQLADEAKEEMLDSEEERTESDFVTPQKATKKEGIRNVAESALTAEMAEQARNEFLKENGREPSLQEFEDLLVSLIASKLAGIELEKKESPVPVKQSPLKVPKTESLMMVTPIKEKERNKNENKQTPPSSDKKAIKFFSPVRDQKTPKQEKKELNSVDRKLMEKAVKHFRCIYQREPTTEENLNLCKFLTTGDLPSIDSDEEKENIENSNPNVNGSQVRKVMFSEEESDDDSDYVPEKDKTCNETKDAIEESDDMSGLVNENGLVDVN